MCGRMLRSLKRASAASSQPSRRSSPTVTRAWPSRRRSWTCSRWWSCSSCRTACAPLSGARDAWNNRWQWSSRRRWACWSPLSHARPSSSAHCWHFDDSNTCCCEGVIAGCSCWLDCCCCGKDAPTSVVRWWRWCSSLDSSGFRCRWSTANCRPTRWMTILDAAGCGRCCCCLQIAAPTLGSFWKKRKRIL